MKPGRELDKLIAEKVMGLDNVRWVSKDGRHLGFTPDVHDDLYRLFKPVPHYSTDIRNAWEVVEKLIKDGHHIDIAYYQKLGPNQDGPPYEAHWSVTGPYKWDGNNIQAYSAPMAICLAALKAVGCEG